MCMDYSGTGKAFGETSVQAVSGATPADQDKLSIYAAQRAADGALTIMVINKTGGELTSNLALANFTPTANAQVYRYSGD